MADSEEQPQTADAEGSKVEGRFSTYHLIDMKCVILKQILNFALLLACSSTTGCRPQVNKRKSSIIAFD